MKNFKKIVGLYRPYKFMLLLAMLASVFGGASDMLMVVIARHLTNDVVTRPKDSAIRGILVTLAVLVGILLLELISKYFREIKMSEVTDKILTSIEHRLFRHYNQMSYSYFDKNKTGEMIGLIDGDVGTISDTIYELPTFIVTLITMSISGVFICTKLNLKLTLVIFPTILLLLGFEIIYPPKIRPIFKKRREAGRAILNFMEDKLSGIRTVISFANEDLEDSRYLQRRDELNGLFKKEHHARYIHRAGYVSLNLAVNIETLIIGSILVVNGELSITDLIFFYTNIYLLLNPIANFSNMQKSLQRGIASIEKITDVLSEEPEIKNAEKTVIKKIDGEITFNDVSFQYETSESNVLTDLTFKIKKGEKVAFVGPSGIGKSTIAGLIPRYYDITKGQILIDDINIKDYDLKSLRKQVGVVEQNVYLFSGTVYENISYAVPNASMEDVIRAAKMANAHEFICQLPDGYNTDIGERGVKLSGGQKQRISIARLFLSNPSIMIFDEATSALDNTSEAEVQKAIDELSKDRTTIIIAHRLSTVKSADRIIFLGKEGVEESGTHEELMKLNGKYAELYKKNK